PIDTIRQRARELYEQNPMLGHRGCRLLNSYPEICEMQATAIFEAATQSLHETGETVICEVMIPLVGIAEELIKLRDLVIACAKSVEKTSGVTIPYSVGTMIELPRAALQAGTIAQYADFFSFGTNDLTQTTFGISRDDSSAFLPGYQKSGIIEFDPFARLDVLGVGELIKIACERGRDTRKDIKTGICGEHGGDPSSIRFCDTLGLDYVSCSPYRVPIARLTAAQATIAAEDTK
ncbi:MAG: putative PEP-binding protein, partial [Pseudomonadota bacterium]